MPDVTLFSPDFWSEERKLVVMFSAVVILAVLSWWLNSRKDRIVPTRLALEFPQHLTPKEERFLNRYEGLRLLVVITLFGTLVLVTSLAVYKNSWPWWLAAAASLFTLVFGAKAMRQKAAELYCNTGWGKSQNLRPDTLQWSKTVKSDCPADDPRLQKANEYRAQEREMQCILAISVFLVVVIAIIGMQFYMRYRKRQLPP